MEIIVIISLLIGVIIVSYYCGYVVGHSKCYRDLKIYKNIVEHDIKYGKNKWNKWKK